MLHLLLTHGLAVVWAASLVESLGAPVPAFPLLLLAGSVAAEYRFSAVPLAIASACGFWIGDLAWYAFGRIQGRRVLGLLCRLSLNPDAKVYERRWLVRHYSIARVEIPELQRLLAAEPVDVLVIDLRSEQAFSRSTQMVPGARRIPPGDFERHIHTMPLDKEIILYCT